MEKLSIKYSTWRFKDHLDEMTYEDYITYHKYRKEIRFLEYALERFPDQKFLLSVYRQVKVAGKLTQKQVFAIRRSKKKWTQQKLWNDEVAEAFKNQTADLDEKIKLLSRVKMSKYDQPFFNSLQEQFNNYERLSDKQAFYIYKFFKKYYKNIMVNLFD